MGVVNETIEDGVGVSWIADQVEPPNHGKLAGDDGGTATVTACLQWSAVWA